MNIEHTKGCFLSVLEEGRGEVLNFSGVFARMKDQPILKPSIFVNKDLSVKKETNQIELIWQFFWLQ